MFVAAVFTGNHNRIADFSVLRQCSFYLAEFDPEPAHLNLSIDAANEFDLARRTIPNQVAGAVQTIAFGRNRIAHKPFLCQFRPIEISARQAVAPDVKLTGYADWNRIAVTIQNVNRGV